MAGPSANDSGVTRESLATRVRRLSFRDWYVPGLIAAFIAFCLGPSLVGARTLLSVNMLTQHDPWASSGSDYAGHEVCTGDTIDAAMPGTAYIRTQLLHGHLGNWQDVVSGGGPLASVPDLGLLNPLSLPYFVLPLWLAPVFIKLLEIVVAVGGTFLFLRRLDVSRPAATLAGFIFATSGFMVMWTNWTQTRTAALIPALFWAVERLIQRRRAGDVALIAVVIGSMLLGGFPAVTGWALYFAAIYLIVRVIALHREQLRTAAQTVGLAIGALVLGGMLALVQLLPFASQYQNTDFSYRADRGTVGLPFTGLFTLLVPNANGLCIGGNPQHGKTNAIELVGYIGAAALVLAVTGIVVGLFRGRVNPRGVWSYLVVATAFIVAIVYCSPRLRGIFVHLPVFSNNPLGRLRSILGFLLAVLAGVGFDALLRWRESGESGQDVSDEATRRRQRRRLVWGVLVCLVVGIAGLVLLVRVRRSAIAGSYLSSLERALIAPMTIVIIAILLVVAAALGAMFIGRSWRVSARTLAFFALPALVVAQGASFFHSVLPGDNPANFYPKTATHQFLAANLGSDRFASTNGMLYPATALYYGLRTPTGHSFQDSAWRDMLIQIDPNVMQSATFSTFHSLLNEHTIGDSPLLDRMAVKYFALPTSAVSGTFQPVPPADGSVAVPNGQSATCQLPAQALRGVTVQLAAPLVAANPRKGPTVTVTARAGDQTIGSARYLASGIGRGPLSVAVPGENLGTGGPITIAVGVADAAGPMILSSSGGAPVCAAVNPVSDGLRLVHADAGSIIYQRLTAMPRIRWASGAVIIPDSAARLAALKRGVPPTDVVLNAAGPTAAGRPATVTVRTDRGGAIAADVNAQGSGYLVVADAMQRPGWSVTVDGKPAKVVHADHAMVAVAVPQGTHRIAFHYRAPGQRTGALLSGVALLILIALVGWEWRRRRLGGKPRGVTQATAAPDQAPPAPASTEPAALRSP